MVAMPTTTVAKMIGCMTARIALTKPSLSGFNDAATSG